MNLLNDIISRIQNIEASWSKATTVPEDLNNLVKGLTKTEIATSFTKLRIRLQNGEDSGQTINSIQYHQLSTQVTNIETYVNQHIPSNPTAHVPNLLPFINQLELGISAILIDPVASGDTERSFTEILKHRLTDSLTKSEVANTILKNTNELVAKNQTAATEVTQILQTSQDASAKIQDRERTTSEATNRINETEKKSLLLATQLEAHIKAVTDNNLNIKKQESDLSQLSKTLSTKLQDAQKLLEDTNRLGLAGAFKTRKDSLDWPAFGWIILFLGSIISLSVLAYLTNQSLTQENKDWHVLLFRIPLSAPLIWLGWFAVKQYGYNRRIQEDYSFKVASALSFQGYKNEVSADPAMVKLLQESAINNFSSNPLRIYETGKNHASPLHEILDQASAEKISKLLDFAKTLYPKK